MTDQPRPGPDTDLLAVRLQSALGEAYEVERVLGAGGFAVVFLVRDLTLKRNLAVKVVSPDLITSAKVLDRFRRETETVAPLSHPNIVPVHFVGERDGLLYLAMAYIDGGSLADRISATSELMPLDAACRAISEVAGALAYAHKRGIIHRDIKPQNVLIDAESGRCLVADFGIARTVEAASLTSTGTVIGTPAYLAPEQVAGEPSDHRVDIFALGVMGYELITGHQPFEAPTPTAVLMKRLGGPPAPMAKFRPGVPREVQDVIDGCLAGDPAERFQSGDAVVLALGGHAPAAAGQGTARFVLKARRRTQRRSLVIGVVCACAAAAALYGFQHRGAKPVAPKPPLVNSSMVVIAAGEYLIGTDSGAPIARPAHRTHLDAFGMERHEVTIGEYRNFAQQTNAPFPWTEQNPDPLLPVTRVRWAEAMSYCRWTHPDGGALPTEDQWEAAARGKEGRAFPWGTRFEPGAANTLGERRNGPARVGSFPRGTTSSGIDDLIGNVWEWTASSMQSYPGRGVMADSLKEFRVIRGGAFNTPEALSASWNRGYSRPAAAANELANTGFRCVMPAR